MINITDFLEKISLKKVILFGTGAASKSITEYLPLKVTFYVDNDPHKWGQKFMGSDIVDPKVLLKENPSNIAVIVASMYYQEISVQLNLMGFKAGEHFWNGLDVFAGVIEPQGQKIILDYPVNPVPRYGYGRPPHSRLFEIINARRGVYQEILENFFPFREQLIKIPSYKPNSSYIGPYWNNVFIPGLDAISIYCFLALNNPKHYFEIGSGNSTKFARQAINDFNLSTKIISIDPWPRDEIDILCDQVIRKPVEEVDPVIFQQLQLGDILFVDNSHRSFMNSDATVVFLDILPYLQKEVLIGIHDIFLPYDYPDSWADRYYSEQYLLASYILAEGTRFQIELPNAFVGNDIYFNNLLNRFWGKFSQNEIEKGGGAFWIKTK